MITQERTNDLAELGSRLIDKQLKNDLWVYGIEPQNPDYQEEISDEARIIISQIGEILQQVSDDPFVAIFRGTNQRFSPNQIRQILDLIQSSFDSRGTH